MKHPDKWRETIDPFSLPYKSFRPTEILGYPHAGNDVFHARGIYDGKEVRAYIKAARQKGAAIENEVAILSQLHSSIYPTVIDYGWTGALRPSLSRFRPPKEPRRGASMALKRRLF